MIRAEVGDITVRWDAFETLIGCDDSASLTTAELKELISHLQRALHAREHGDRFLAACDRGESPQRSDGNGD